MADDPGLAFRVLRRGLRAASRAGSTVVERVLRNDTEVGPFEGFVRSAVPRASSGPVEVRIGTEVARVRAGTTLLEAAKAVNIDIRHYCGGNCSCGTCRVSVKRGQRNLSKRKGIEEMVLGPDATARGDRLACQAQANGEVEIEIPEWF